MNVCAISKNSLSVFLVNNQVSSEEGRLLSFDVLNCLLHLSASRFALPSIPLMVLHSLVTSVFWSKVSTKSFHFCVHSCGSGCHNSVLAGQARCGLFHKGHLVLVITSNISAGTGSSWSLCRPVGMWCDAALSRHCTEDLLISLAVH